VLTISQLAAYAGVTVRAVRHYHHIGLMPEPARYVSGYRSYGAGDVVRLIRIRTLAEAGVPLARVQYLLDATTGEFGEAVAQVDVELRAKIRELQEHRRRIARLAAGDSLALPPDVVVYLDKLREGGAPEAMVEGERDAWILIAARWPEKITEFMVDKMAQLDDPRTMQLYRLIGELLEVGIDEDRLSALADMMAELLEESAERGELDRQGEEMSDDAFIALLDSFASDAHPMVERLRELLAERGWIGWIRIERAADPSATRESLRLTDTERDTVTTNPARYRRTPLTRLRVPSPGSAAITARSAVTPPPMPGNRSPCVRGRRPHANYRRAPTGSRVVRNSWSGTCRTVEGRASAGATVANERISSG
jgi:DNA-binding transcriptional MerR regulator